MSVDDQALIEAARDVQKNAYAPYSNYHVGAAVLDDQGRIHVGCNVENAAFPEGSCAEANAIGTMVSAGSRTIAAIAVVGGSGGAMVKAAIGRVDACTPCGGCRQNILEFSNDDTRIILLDGDGNPQIFSIDQLLPASFKVLR